MRRGHIYEGAWSNFCAYACLYLSTPLVHFLEMPLKECMTRECSACADLLLQVSPYVSHPVSSQWQTTDGKAKKITFQGTTEDAFYEQTQHFLFHSYVKRKQAASFKKLTESCDNKNIVIQVDYSENVLRGRYNLPTGVTHKLRCLLFMHGLVVWMERVWSSFQMI